MKISFTIFIIISLLIHILMPTVLPEKPKVPDPKNIVKLTLNGTKNDKGDHKKVTIPPKANSGHKACTDSFGGVGIIHEHQESGGAMATQVGKDYPAYRAGVREGDVVFNWWELRGVPGTKVVIKFSHNGVLQKVEVTKKLFAQNPKVFQKTTDKVFVIKRR